MNINFYFTNQLFFFWVRVAIQLFFQYLSLMPEFAFFEFALMPDCFGIRILRISFFNFAKSLFQQIPLNQILLPSSRWFLIFLPSTLLNYFLTKILMDIFRQFEIIFLHNHHSPCVKLANKKPCFYYFLHFTYKVVLLIPNFLYSLIFFSYSDTTFRFLNKFSIQRNIINIRLSGIIIWGTFFFVWGTCLFFFQILTFFKNSWIFTFFWKFIWIRRFQS